MSGPVPPPPLLGAHLFIDNNILWTGSSHWWLFNLGGVGEEQGLLCTEDFKRRPLARCQEPFACLAEMVFMAWPMPAAARLLPACQDIPDLEPPASHGCSFPSSSP